MKGNLDILLVNVGGTKKIVYQDLSKEFSAVDPPFWAALTAGYLRKNGFNVDILDSGGLNLDEEETAEKIKEKKLMKECIVISFPPGIDFIINLMGSILSGHTAVPISTPLNIVSKNRGNDKILKVIQNSQAELVLTTKENVDIFNNIGIL